MSNLIRLLFICVSSAAVISCGGGGGGGAEAEAQNVSPSFTSTAAISVAEGTVIAYTAAATDADGDTLTYSLTGGVDQSKLSLDTSSGVLSFNIAPDFEAPIDSGNDNSYEVEVTVSDGTDSVAITVAITVTNVNEAPVFTSGAAISMAEKITATGYTATATDVDGDTLAYSLTGGVDQALLSIDGTSGVLSFSTAPDYLAPSDSGSNNTYIVEISANDGTLLVAQTVTITVTDATAPTVSSTTPASAAIGVARNSDVTATFDEDIFATTVDTSSFTLANTDTSANMSGAVSFDGGTNVATLNPDNDLAVLTSYTATLNSSVTDLAGNALSNYNWAFTTADGAWAGANTDQIEADDNDASAPQIALDSSGNAIAVWVQYNNVTAYFDIYANRYDAGTGLWGTAEPLELNNDANAFNPQVAMDANGNAFAIWRQFSNVGYVYNIYVNRYVASTGLWGGAELIESDNTGHAGFPQITFDATGNAIAVWEQFVGGIKNIYTNRYLVGTDTWESTATPILLDTEAGEAQVPQVAIDTTGNAMVVWQQVDSSGFVSIYANRYDVGTNLWAGATLIENLNSSNTGALSAPQVGFDGSGNAIAVWSQWSTASNRYDIYANRYVASTDSWPSTTATLLETTDEGGAFRPQIAIDASGNAIAVWRQYVSAGLRFNIYANRYNVGTDSVPGSWSGAALLETNDDGPADYPQIAFDTNGNAIAVWQQEQPFGLNNIYASRYVASTNTWDGATLLETDATNAATAPQVAIDANGTAVAIWVQTDGARTNIWSNRFE